MASSFKNAHRAIEQANTDEVLYAAGNTLTAAIIHACYFANKHVTATCSVTLKIADDSNKNGVGSLVDATPTTGEGNLSGAWEAGKSWTNIAQTSVVDNNGTIATSSDVKFSILTDSAGLPTFTVTTPGKNYGQNYVITVTDPGSTSNTATLTVLTVTGALDMTILQQVPVPPNTTLSLDKPLNLAPSDVVKVQTTHTSAEVFASVLEQS